MGTAWRRPGMVWLEALGSVRAPECPMGVGCVTGSRLAQSSFLLTQCGKTSWHGAPVLRGCSAR